jgi:hypothetical protein
MTQALRRLVAGFPPRRPGFDPSSGHVGFLVETVALGQVFSEHLGFPCQFSFHRVLHTHYLSSGAGTLGQILADVQSGLSLTPTPRNKRTKLDRLADWPSVVIHSLIHSLIYVCDPQGPTTVGTGNDTPEVPELPSAWGYSWATLSPGVINTER